MIDVSKIIHSKNFEQNITIIRTSNGHFEKSEYKCDTATILLKGIMVNPKNSKEIVQTEQGDRAAGYVDIYVDASTEIYVTRDKTDGKDISDIVICGGSKYRVTNVYDRSQWGFFRASAIREGAI